ncbi:MerR family transcriptional regulator [Hwanghaeella grinnelliae]|uniref:MerR family transcriptional regulator n=1 Tax=Hwanghaeella grinnelliae TaxID=2500179 RepID=A0A3S3UL28_9PROT|nr:MerR family transcriptional regulator [Hwanghaeella grinnelliae]RVU33767.1 MerR family transcriptional regulator [Hwanghaeella grinnelliae]
MRISDVAAACGLSADTIRYYEKSGLIPTVGRGADGHRRFSKENVDWLTLLYWLRETGMSMVQMRRFCSLAQEGDKTKPERRRILVDHAAELDRRRAQLDRCEAVLQVKIRSYDKRQ